MDGETDEWIDEQRGMNGWMDRQIARQIAGQIARQKNEGIDELMEK